MKSNCRDDGDVKTPHARAVVGHLLAVLVRQWLSLDVDAGQEVVEGALNGAKDPVDGPCLLVGVCASVGEVEKMLCEIKPALVGRCACRELSIVIGCANPHVPHEQWEAQHHHSHTGSSTKVEMRACINLGVAALLPAVNDAASLLGGAAIGTAVCVSVRLAVGATIERSIALFNLGARGDCDGVLGHGGR